MSGESLSIRMSSAQRDAAGGRLGRPGGQMGDVHWSAQKEGDRGGTNGSPAFETPDETPHRRRRIPEPRPSERTRARTAGRYVELHCHSAYSFLDGASQPEELASRAAESDTARSRSPTTTASTARSSSRTRRRSSASGRSPAPR